MANLTALGILLETLAAALGTISKQLIACSANLRVSTSRRCTLAIGIFLNVAVGPILDGAAYAFAAQTVIAPFASLDVLFNALTAPCTLKWQREKFTFLHVVAAAMVTGGASCAAVLASNEKGRELLTCDEIIHQLTRWQSLVYMAMEIVFGSVALILIRRNDLGRVQGMALGGFAGLLMGNVFFTKAFVGLLRKSFDDGDWAAFMTATPYMLLLTALGCSGLGTFFMQRGLVKYKGIYMVTIFEGVHITAACVSGDIVMEEMAESPWLNWVGYWASISGIIGGIALINYISTEVELDSAAREALSVLSTLASLREPAPGSFNHLGTQPPSEGLADNLNSVTPSIAEEPLEPESSGYSLQSSALQTSEIVIVATTTNARPL